MVNSIGLRELRQHASEVVRRVEAGEELTVTVSGRAAARLVPVEAERWRSGPAIAHVWDTTVDVESWRADREQLRDLLDDAPRDPWDAGRNLVQVVAPG